MELNTAQNRIKNKLQKLSAAELKQVNALIKKLATSSTVKTQAS